MHTDWEFGGSGSVFACSSDSKHIDEFGLTLSIRSKIDSIHFSFPKANGSLPAFCRK
jgi:hypothetical protein